MTTARLVVNKTTLRPIGDTPPIPRPWYLMDAETKELIGCYATRTEAEFARIRVKDGGPAYTE